MKGGARASSTDGPDPRAARQAAEAEQRVLRHIRLALPLGALVATVAAGLTLGPGPAVLVLTGFALLAAIESLWSSLQALLGEAPLSTEDAYAFGAPSSEEEQKRAVLRALKDLEFERSVGKISEDDFARLTARCRADAKRLLRVIDEQARPGREKVELLVDQVLRQRGLDPGAAAATETDADADAETDAETDAAAAADGETDADADADAETDADAAPHRCPECETPNDADAVFCKKCGERLVPDDEARS